MTMPMWKFLEISEAANALIAELGQGTDGVAERPLDKQQATDIAFYLLRVPVAWAGQKLEAECEAIIEEHTDIISDLGESISVRSKPSSTSSHGVRAVQPRASNPAVLRPRKPSRGGS